MEQRATDWYLALVPHVATARTPFWARRLVAHAGAVQSLARVRRDQRLHRPVAMALAEPWFAALWSSDPAVRRRLGAAVRDAVDSETPEGVGAGGLAHEGGVVYMLWGSARLRYVGSTKRWRDAGPGFVTRITEHLRALRAHARGGQPVHAQLRRQGWTQLCWLPLRVLASEPLARAAEALLIAVSRPRCNAVRGGTLGAVRLLGRAARRRRPPPHLRDTPLRSMWGSRALQAVLVGRAAALAVVSRASFGAAYAHSQAFELAAAGTMGPLSPWAPGYRGLLHSFAAHGHEGFWLPSSWSRSTAARVLDAVLRAVAYFPWAARRRAQRRVGGALRRWALPGPWVPVLTVPSHPADFAGLRGPARAGVACAVASLPVLAARD